VSSRIISENAGSFTNYSLGKNRILPGSIGKSRIIIGKIPCTYPKMDVKEILKFADDLVFTKTGKHLDDVQDAVLRGAWKGNTYTQIAEESGYSDGHLRDIASQLWKILSGILGEEVNKSNFRSTIERCRLSITSSTFENNFANNNINICRDIVNSPAVSQVRSHPKPDSDKPQTCQDLRDAPDITPLYDRTLELTTLEQWIVGDRTRLIAILGLSGIGKTAIALHLLPQIQHQFEYVVWRSLRTSPTLETTLKNLIKFISDRADGDLPVSTDDRLSILIEYLRSHRCLIILDDVQTILSSGQIAGNYRPEYENYGTLFRLISEIPHNSCLILNSWEPPREIAALTGETAPVRTLYLGGLGTAASEIFKDKGLLEDENWQTIINTYGGNPLWLKIVATMIQELFNGKVSEYLKYDILFLGEELKTILQQHLNRLSNLEKQVITHIGNAAESISISQLIKDMKLPASELINAVQSLRRRSLIEKQEQENVTLLNLSPTFRQYVKKQ
jgi:DNA-binding MarR family transcriptional regulator